MRILVVELVLFLFFHRVLTKADDELLMKYKPYESYVEFNRAEFKLGCNDRHGINYEFPPKQAKVNSFRIMMYPVTIASFRHFIQTKHNFELSTDKNGFSYVFNRTIGENAEILKIEVDEIAKIKHMEAVRDALWNKPEGGISTSKDRLNFPAVHVSYEDASAFCSLKGMRLPTEIEWEYAARGGLAENSYPWGDDWQLKRCNLWQGDFPDENQMRDGHYGLAPVDAYPAQNAFEMYDMLGNTWEWTSSVYRDLHDKKDSGYRHVVKGGSFLETRDGEMNYLGLKMRISARLGLPKNYTAQNLGFRCAQSIRKDSGELAELDGKVFRVVKVRAPVIHRLSDSFSANGNKDEF